MDEEEQILVQEKVLDLPLLRWAWIQIKILCLSLEVLRKDTICVNEDQTLRQ